MKSFPRLIATSVAVITGCATADFHQDTGTQQNWPTASGTFVSTKYDVPAYYGPPNRPYIVLGSLDVTTGPPGGNLATRAEGGIEFAAGKAKKMGLTPLSCEDMAKFKQGHSQWRAHLQTAAPVAVSRPKPLGITSTGKLTIADI